MAEKQNYLSLGKSKIYIYNLLEILMYVYSKSCYKFLFGLNRESRCILEHNYQKFERGFENEGLAIKHIGMSDLGEIYETLK